MFFISALNFKCRFSSDICERQKGKEKLSLARCYMLCYSNIKITESAHLSTTLTILQCVHFQKSSDLRVCWVCGYVGVLLRDLDCSGKGSFVCGEIKSVRAADRDFASNFLGLFCLLRWTNKHILNQTFAFVAVLE